FGFGNKGCSGIKACLNSSRASILINGSPTSEFSIKRGLKAFNLALLQKWRWRLLSSPNALWVQVIKAYHG
ncbi:hypothetical protein Tco_0330765, partial [Tanacetum coccineum]